MFKLLLNTFFKRLLIAILLGAIGATLLELLFKLQYRNYDMFSSVEWILGAILLTVLFQEVLFLLNNKLDKKVGWDAGPVKRLIIQSISFVVVALIIFSGIRLLYAQLFSSKSFILLVDEVSIALFIIFIVLIMNIVDFVIVLVNQWRFSLAEAEKYKKESAEFEFEMLQAQINPHFLFNSLNTLSSLVYEDADRSADFIRKLSDVYRHVLESRNKDIVSIKEELEFTKSFIFLLEIRFDQKLNIHVEIDEEKLDKQIPPLTLQLLIENAVKHNIVSEKKPLSIKVFNDENYVLVENPLQLKPGNEERNGMGLKNISNRYKAICNKTVIIDDSNNKFTVKVPII